MSKSDEKKPAEPPVVEYPAWRYHKDGVARIVETAEEDKALGKGWSDTPILPAKE